MAKKRPEYEMVDEFMDLARELQKKYPEVFEDVPVHEMTCYKITNKDRPESRSKMYQIEPVKMPIALDVPYDYYVTIWASDWDGMSDKYRLLLVAEILNRIPQEEKDKGKVLPFDVRGDSTMIRTFKGIDYLDDPNSPHLLEDEIQWVTNPWDDE